MKRLRRKSRRFPFVFPVIPNEHDRFERECIVERGIDGHFECIVESQGLEIEERATAEIDGKGMGFRAEPFGLRIA